MIQFLKKSHAILGQERESGSSPPPWAIPRLRHSPLFITLTLPEAHSRGSTSSRPPSYLCHNQKRPQKKRPFCKRPLWDHTATGQIPTLVCADQEGRKGRRQRGWGAGPGACRAPACWGSLLFHPAAEGGRAPKLKDLIHQSCSGEAGLTPETMGSKWAKPTTLPGKETHLEVHPVQPSFLSSLSATPLLSQHHPAI